MAIRPLAKKHYWARAMAVSLGAFLLGSAAYILLGILLAQNATVASGTGFQQVTVVAQLDDLVLKFIHDQPSSGAGDINDPFVLYNSKIRMVIGVVGEGTVTVEDHNENVLWSREKVGAGRLRTVAEYAEYTAEIDLPGGIGEYRLMVKLNGVNAVGPNVQNPIHFSYRTVPIAPDSSERVDASVAPSVPATGDASILYMGGYAVRTTGVVCVGGIVGLIVLLWFVVMALRGRGSGATRRSY